MKDRMPVQPWRCGRCGRLYYGECGEKGPPGWELRVRVMPNGGMMLCDECLKKEREGLTRERVLSEALQDGITKGALKESMSLTRFGDSLATEPIPCHAGDAEEDRALVVTICPANPGPGDLIEPDGIHLSGFRENPVILFHHRHDLPAIGKALWVRIVGGEGGSPKRLVAKIKFARTRLGEELYHMYSQGYMESWAMGFVPTEWTLRKGGGVHVGECELKEISAIPVPGRAQYGAVYDSIRGGEITDPVLLQALDAESSQIAKRACQGGGLHHDQGKLRLDLVPPEADEAIAGILGHSAATGKYEERNWEKGLGFMCVYGSVRRHYLAWLKGEDIDPESGLPHLDHALTDTAFLVTYAKRGMVGFDDRPSTKEGS